MKEILDKLKESGLDKTDFDALNFKLVENAKELESYFEKRKALKINYHSINGKQTDFYRLRYIGKGPTSFKENQRYTQPADFPPQFYLPSNYNFSKIKNNIKKDLFITEGEFKAAKACKEGFPTIGLGGVWNWKSKKKKLAEINDFQLFKWNKRKVYLVFDSDLVTNANVRLALNQLAQLLTKKGAIPHIIYLPELPNLKNAGLDDFIVAKGKKAFEDLVDMAEAYSLAEDLHKINEMFTYVYSVKKVIEHETNELYSMDEWVKTRYANQFFEVDKVDKKGNVKRIPAPIAPEWRKWEHRSDARRLVYSPGEPLFTSTGDYNEWLGWGVQPSKGDIQPWLTLIDAVFGNNTAARDWFESWVAVQFQQPGIKLFQACLIWSVPTGTGKSLIGYTLGKIFGSSNFEEIGQSALQSDFTETHNKQFIMGSEITGGDGSRKFADILKQLITGEKSRVNKKHVQAYYTVNHANYYFNSNRSTAMYLEDNDRRFFVHEVLDHDLSLQFFKQYVNDWMHGGGPAALFYYYKYEYVLADHFDPYGRAYETESKSIMIEDNKSSLGYWVDQLANDPASILGKVEKRDLFTSAELANLYNLEQDTDTLKVGVSAMSRSLKHRFRLILGGKQIRPVDNSGGSPLRYLCIRNQEFWFSHNDLDTVKTHLRKTLRSAMLKGGSKVISTKF